MRGDPVIARLIDRTARKYGLEPAVVGGIAMQESSWNPRATRFEPHWAYFTDTAGFAVPASSVRGIPIMKDNTTEMQSEADEREKRQQATSWGLMQTMGSVVREHGFRGADLSVLKMNAALALEYGCMHFAKYARKYDLVDAISAYNAGPGGIGSNPEYVSKVSNYTAVFREQGLGLEVA